MHNIHGNVTVEQALKKGKWQLIYMTVLLLLVTMGAVWLGVFLLPDYDGWLIGVAYCIFALLAICIVPGLYYYTMLPRWRIWAFTNVRNVHELKQRAILARILYEDNSLSTRLQIMNERQREQLRQLQHKFEQPDEFVDDLTVLFETVYTSEKSLKTGLILPFVFLIAGGVMFYLEEYGTAIMCVCVATFVCFLHFRAVGRLKGATLTLSNDGITTKNAGFHPWQVIEEEKILVIGGDSTTFLLAYNVAGEKIQIFLSDYTAPPKDVDHLLRVYRGRYEAQNRKKMGLPKNF